MPIPNPKKTEQNANLAELRKKVTSLVAKNAVAMVQCAIDSVLEDGQYQAIKYLFEMVEIYPAVASESEDPEDSLSKILLKRLGVSLPEADGRPSGSGEGDSYPVE
jgi:hypothetical protein